MEAAAIEPLAAPCTEVFTAYGAESGFLDNAKRFAEALGAEKPNGYFGSAVGEGVDGEGTVMMLLGWESVQAHGEAKGVDGGGGSSWMDVGGLPTAADGFGGQLSKGISMSSGA